MTKVILDDQLFNIETGYLIKVIELYGEKDQGGQWFRYYVIRGYNDDFSKGLSPFEQGSISKHNGWDWKNHLLDPKFWVKIENEKHLSNLELLFLKR